MKRASPALAFTLALAALAVSTGCVEHISPYKAKHRNFEAGEYADAPKAASGSLFAGGARGLVEDDRATRVGDLIIIQIDENDSATRNAQTALSSSNQANIDSSGLLDKLKSITDIAKLFGFSSSSGFTGAGSIQRNGTLSATLPVRVRKVLPNDDLYVEGTKVVMVGAEEHHLYVSGIIRQSDVRGDGSVPSAAVADAEIEYTGRGDINDKQRPGWLSRILSKVSPY